MDIERAIVIAGTLVIIPVVFVGMAVLVYAALVVVLLILSIIIATFTYIHDKVKSIIKYKENIMIPYTDRPLPTPAKQSNE